MPGFFPFFRLAVPAVTVALAFAGEPSPETVAQLEEDYRLEQARIDLVLSELALKASKEENSPEESQSAIDRWIRANTARLEAQAELAAELDRLSPLPVPEPPLSERRKLNPFLKNQEKAGEYAALEETAAKAIAALGERAENPEHLQKLVDEWIHGEEGAAVLKKKQALLAEASAELLPGAEVIAPEAMENSSPEELEAMDWSRRSARRITGIRKAHPTATPEEMQILIDRRKAEFEEDRKQIARLMKTVEAQRLKSGIELLRAEVPGRKPANLSASETMRKTATGENPQEEKPPQNPALSPSGGTP